MNPCYALLLVGLLMLHMTLPTQQSKWILTAIVLVIAVLCFFFGVSIPFLHG